MDALRSLASVACVALAFYLFAPSLACNEAVCASIASKCMLTGSCKCDMTDLSNCTCCKNCSTCLGKLYEECCYCFKMCPKPERSWSELAMTSEVEDFAEPDNGLFKVFTEVPDESKRWISFTFPVDHHISNFKLNSKQYKIQIVSVDEPKPAGAAADGSAPEQITLNCTVAYLTQCRSRGKCSSACRSMSASSFRWFHNGCCECIGHTCINYGINESRCTECNDDDEEDPLAYVSDAEFDEAIIEAVRELPPVRNQLINGQLTNDQLTDDQLTDDSMTDDALAEDVEMSEDDLDVGPDVLETEEVSPCSNGTSTPCTV